MESSLKTDLPRDWGRHELPLQDPKLAEFPSYPVKELTPKFPFSG